MKKIAFVLNSMNMGGTEKTFLNLINSMNLEEFDITLYLLEKEGELLKDVPASVKIIEIENYKLIKQYVHNNIYQIVKKEIEKYHFFRALKFGISYTISKIKKDITIYYDSFSNIINHIEVDYDLVAAYQGPMNYITYLVDKKFYSSKKVCWIHFDISKMGYTREGASKIYQNIDKIFIVSSYAKGQFVREFPELKEKCEVFYNILPKQEILKKANLIPDVVFDDEYINILTIGRISRQKGHDIIPKILNTVRNKGFRVRWYLIGGVEKCDANDPLDKLKYNINKYKLNEEIINLGIKENPYPYIKMCDIYVQPSRYEGYCTTTNEAKLFNVPIITTNVSGADEQFKDYKTGLIVAFDPYLIAEKIIELIENKNIYNDLKENLKYENMNSCDSSENLLIDLLRN